MLNELGNYCVPDLNTVLFGYLLLISTLTIELWLQYNNTYWTVNGFSVEDGFSLSLSHSLTLSLSLSLSQCLYICMFIMVERLIGFI